MHLAPNQTVPDTAPATMRTCGACTLCCRLPDIEALEKPANQWCRHCSVGQGCAIYADRPTLCRDFLCSWMQSRIGAEWQPEQAHMMVYNQGRQITVLVDPDFPTAWQEQPYAGHLRQWARDAEAQGGYVIIFIGDDVMKIDAVE
ncbi:hypothetical protein [Agrobacterium vitis]|uniref:hypothetical protein n=1 Tax=Agrobacterium vitis TaxID=373 RepID=UPI001F31E985|nr:hypothetical protein [Agrobacterium vitis]